MSFKRDGDDSNQLGVLRRRRVKELFAEDIPEDEALQTSNGRYACLVCGNRPVFDTVLVLSQHRQGKKHQAYMVQFQEKKDELQILIKQRRQEQYLKDGTTDIKQVRTSHKGLGCGHKYDPRVKKKFQSQKNRVNLEESASVKATDCHHNEVPTATEISSLPGVSSAFSGIKPSTTESGILKGNSSMNNLKTSTALNTACTSTQFNTNENFREHFLGQKGPFLHDKQLKNIFSGPKSNSFTPVPYKRKATSNEELKVKHIKESQHSELNSSSQLQVGCASINKRQHDTCTEELPAKLTCAAKKCKDNKPKTTVQEDEKRLKEKQKLANKYLYYRGGGWKKNWKGEWIKDEDVEFDSDEEPPDLP